MSMHPEINYFKTFKGDCDCFIETGTYWGDGITLAIQAGFTLIHSIDIEDQIPPWYKHELTYYTHIGDSAEKLKQLLPELEDKKIMFWLDAHSSLLEGSEDNFPLEREIKVIGKFRKNKGDVILIDDYLYMTHPLATGLSHTSLEYMIKQEIGWSYKISYLSNPIKKNILIAHL